MNIQYALCTVEDLNVMKPVNSLLTVTEIAPKIMDGKKYISAVKVICKCGKEIIIATRYFARGDRKSCGCSYNGKLKKPKIIYKTHRLRKKFNRGDIIRPIYISYFNMLNRCYNQKHISYPRYGAKGVYVCEEWRNDYKAFQKWALENGWQKGLQLDKDKIGNGKLYSPSNCCWLTPLENATLNAPRYNYEGELRTITEIHNITKIPKHQLYKLYAKNKLIN